MSEIAVPGETELKDLKHAIESARDLAHSNNELLLTIWNHLHPQSSEAEPNDDPPESYHKWYYSTGELWKKTKYLGVPVLKSVQDLWNYQEILFDLRPDLVVEFGAYNGGSALYFAKTLKAINPSGYVLSFDITLGGIHPSARAENLRFFELDTASPKVAEIITEYRKSTKGKVFFILDSDHRKEHVLRELNLIRSLTRPGDYVIVEDGNVNGHPVLPGWGEGPYEAIAEYEQRYPGDYRHDTEQEHKFGWTFAPNGYLVRL